MKIAIHCQKGSFSDDWLSYCKTLDIDIKRVNCYASDIVRQMEDCDALMWHFHHANSKDILFAKQLMYSLETSGKIVFPDFYTCWFFDDKVGQKYLLESVDAPLVPSYVFYDRETALEWVESAHFPKVFKLRRGASSANVQLARTRQDALKLTQRAFNKGFLQYRPFPSLKERWRKYRIGKNTLLDVLKGVIRLVYKTDFDRVAGRERGYVYFQDFIPDKKYDLRLIVNDGRAFGIKRHTRPSDFRASGSGLIEYDKNQFDEEIILLSFELAGRLKTSTISIDYVYDKHPLIVEISYGYDTKAYRDCPGYWDRSLKWHEGPFNPQHWMVDQVVRKIREKNSEESLF